MRLAELGLLLLQMVVGATKEGGNPLKLSVEILLVFSVSDLDMHEETIGHKMEFMTKVFDQHAGMSLHFIKALINRFESPVHLHESLVNLLEAAIQATYEPIKSFTNILNQFLIHTASVAR